MSPTISNHLGQYALATGADAVGRLQILHKIYSPAGRQFLLEAGLAQGMRVADFGCGSGFVSRMLAEMVGPSGSVTGVDVNGAQVEEARKLSTQEGLANTSFVEASAYDTGLPRSSFDLVYCRFLLLHLADPGACLREMRDILKPGGILVIEDGDLATAASIPPTALDAFADLFCRLGPLRGVDYSIANRLCHLVAGAGLSLTHVKVHQPADRTGQNGLLLKWSVQEAGSAFVDAGLITSDRLQRTIADMQAALEDSTVLVLGPRMSLVCARKLPSC
jgi:SAM-dependent methyltransferase